MEEIMLKKKMLLIGLFVTFFSFGILQNLEAQTYFIREGTETADSYEDFQQGEFSSPHLKMYPYLRETDRGFLTLPQVENYLRNYGFTPAQVNRVRNFLTTGQRTAFLYYINAENYFRWIWITFYE